MKKLYWIIPAIIAILYVIISVAKGEWNPLKWFSTAPVIDECAEKNKLKNEGEECIICAPPTVRATGVKGIIKDGVCVLKEVAPAFQSTFSYDRVEGKCIGTYESGGTYWADIEECKSRGLV